MEDFFSRVGCARARKAEIAAHPPAFPMGAPDARAASCMAGALTFFEALGRVRAQLALGRAAWGNLALAARAMEESLSYLRECDPGLPVGELKLLLENFKFAIGTRNRVLAKAAVREVEKFLRRRYREPLAVIDWKVVEAVRRGEVRWGGRPRPGEAPA